jgi:hypothetical protein
MPRLLGDAAGERLEPLEYRADFRRSFRLAREFWKLERGQVYAEPGEPSWEAFNGGDWDESMRLAEELREGIKQYHEANVAAGMTARRIRIVALPPTPYLRWELQLLKIRDETGAPIRVLDESAVADLEDEGPLPDICTMDRDVMYQVVYDEHGVLAYGLRYTDKPLVSRCRDLIAELYGRGEPIGGFFAREIADLPPPCPVEPALPRDHLETTGRPRTARS